MIETSLTSAVVSPYLSDGLGLFPSQYGYFDSETGEYVVTDVLTPRPWINVLANESYGLVLSQAGGGFSWFENCQLFRVNRWEQDLVSDAYGRYVYLADEDEPNDIWSTTLMPTRREADSEEVRHGLGFTTFKRTCNELTSEQTIFVPAEGSYEIHLVTLTNGSERTRTIRVGTYLEWHLGSQGEWHREFHRLFVSTKVDGDTVLAWKQPSLEEHVKRPTDAGPFAFVRLVGVEGVEWFSDKSQWLGRLGQVSSPRGMVTHCPPKTSGRWDDPIAAARFKVSLAEGETRSFAIVIGVDQDKDNAGRVAKAMTLEGLRQQCQETKTYHRESHGRLRLETGEPAIDVFANLWLPYQTTVGRMTARCAYYQQGGAFGYRDQLQDSLMHLDTDPERTLRQIKIHAEAMYEDGSVKHWWHPGTNIFAKSRHSDTCLWLAFAVLEYLDETGDLDALKTDLAYAADGQGSARGTLLDHCLRGIERALAARSPRGLTLIGAGDWNDGLSHAGLDGKGESAWLAMFLFSILRRFAVVMDALGDEALSSRFLSEAESLRQAVEDQCWDGEWYIAGTDDEGRPFGSKQCREGEIFLNPQTWAVISGIASPERAARAMASARQHLIKPYGALLLAPAYQTVNPNIGYITRYAPGLRENGGVYSHAATWAVQALAMMGEVDAAYDLWLGMCPPLRSAANADLYAAEPYVMPGNTDGPDSPFESRAGWTWYTGSSAWMRRTLVRWILGVRSGKKGLEVWGTAPERLASFSMNRPYRGKVVTIRNGAISNES
ncbi:MAG: glycosyl transferase family 36 [Armatimonadetes bacterium]|nr:glycosyl transferase family 36 [Armatimonadota bacterium]